MGGASNKVDNISFSSRQASTLIGELVCSVVKLKVQSAVATYIAGL